MAGQRLERLGKVGEKLAADTFGVAAEQRPDHPASHRLSGYALARLGEYEKAFAALEAGCSRSYPDGRFAAAGRILKEDLGLIAKAWMKAEPGKADEIQARLTKLGITAPNKPSLRFVLMWETDANDVDFHIHDGKGNHAYYSTPHLSSGGDLYADVTTGYGPECFTIQGVPQTYPYKIQAHYYRRGPMGYGMGSLHVLRHDGRGNLKFDFRPFVIMVDGAFVDLGTVEKGW
jgi:hypothetical protein